MRPRLWGGIALVLLLGVVFVRACVRFVPGDAPRPIPSADTGRAGTGPLLIPVDGVPASALVDTFRQSRSGGSRTHDAIDIMAARGTAVLAATDGRVEKIFWSEAGGRTIYQRSPDGRLSFYYAHLDAYDPDLHEGQMLRSGQRIATVGSTGNAQRSAPHLHFAVHVMAPGDRWYGGRAINPYPMLAADRSSR